MSLHFVYMGDDHESIRINAADFLIEFSEFPIGNDSHDDRLV